MRTKEAIDVFRVAGSLQDPRDEQQGTVVWGAAAEGHKLAMVAELRSPPRVFRTMEKLRPPGAETSGRQEATSRASSSTVAKMGPVRL